MSGLSDPIAFLRQLFDRAVATADTLYCEIAALPPKPSISFLFIKASFKPTSVNATPSVPEVTQHTDDQAPVRLKLVAPSDQPFRRLRAER